MAASAELTPSPGPPPTDAAAESPAPPRSSWRKLLWLALLAAVLLAVVYGSPLRGYLGRWREVGGQIRQFGLLAPLVVTFGVAVLVAAGFPRLLFCVIAGLALGFWQGLLWAQLGTLLGNYALFLVARSAGRDWAGRYLARRGRLRSLLRLDGVPGVILARQLPVPGLLINLACGLLPLRHRDFLLGTVLGQLPEAVPCTLIGAGVLEDTPGKSAWVLGLAVVLVLVGWLGARWFRGRWSGAATAVQPATPPPGAAGGQKPE